MYTLYEQKFVRKTLALRGSNQSLSSLRAVSVSSVHICAFHKALKISQYRALSEILCGYFCDMTTRRPWINISSNLLYSQLAVQQNV